jgi:hypothetical protein
MLRSFGGLQTLDDSDVIWTHIAFACLRDTYWRSWAGFFFGRKLEHT